MTRLLRHAASALALALAAVLAGYLAFNVPGSWFPAAGSLEIDAGRLAVSRGRAQAVPGALLVTAAAPGEAAVVVVSTELRADQYAGVDWHLAGVPEDANVRLLWRTNYRPDRLNIVPMIVDGGRIRPIVIAGDRNWVGTIQGLGIAIGNLPPTGVAIRGVTVRPLGAAEILALRLGEWLAFEGWRATSVESMAGGSDAQDLPLPLVLAAAIALAVGGFALRHRFGPAEPTPSMTAFALVVFAAAWAISDARWTFELARQSLITLRTYGGTSSHEAHLAAEDAALYRLVLAARAKLPTAPARVFVLAEAPYFRARAAYYLYPHNPWFDVYRSGWPDVAMLRTGDWVLTYRRRGVQFDEAQQRLRWDGSPALAAELALATADGALFRLR